MLNIVGRKEVHKRKGLTLVALETDKKKIESCAKTAQGVKFIVCFGRFPAFFSLL